MNNKKYVLGVDGGNTKTDFFLFKVDGAFVDFIRVGTCSHEALPDSFEGAKRELGKGIESLLSKNNIKKEELAFSVFGLAGCDIPLQHDSLVKAVTEIGLKDFIIANDSFLGIKAVSESGVCSICGTGTAAGGIGLDGKTLQVGGIGSICGDEAGGSWLARRAVKATFDAAYRFGKPSYIEKIVYDELAVNDKYYLMEAISLKLFTRKVDLTRITKEVFNGANLGDEVCIEMLKEMANNLARSASGCIVNLKLKEKPLVIMIGSVFVKGACPVLVDEFKRLVNYYTKKDCEFVMLTVPPATGAIIWAIEEATKAYPDKSIKEKIIKEVKDNLERLEK